MPVLFTGTREEALQHAASLCCCGGAGSGSGGLRCAPGGTCSTISSGDYMLSVNAIQLSTLLGAPYTDNLPRFLGDFRMRYLIDEVVQRDVDEFCKDVNVSVGTGWFSDWIDATDYSPPQYWRYYYGACTGELALHYKALDVFGCYLDDYYVRLPEPPVTTLTVTDCSPYLASASGTVFTGSVAA